GLVEGTDFAVLAQDRAGTDIGEWSNVGIWSDHRLGGFCSTDGSIFTDLNVVERGVGTNRGTSGNGGCTVQLRVGFNRDVLGQFDVNINPGGGRVDNGDPGTHPALRDASVQFGAEGR